MRFVAFILAMVLGSAYAHSQNIDVNSPTTGAPLKMAVILPDSLQSAPPATVVYLKNLSQPRIG